MKPERARELYTDYAEGTLAPALRLAMEQHFAADADARADYTEFERVLSLLGTLEREPVEVPSGFRAKVLERVSVEQSQRAAAPGISGWFQNWGRRRVVAGSVAALAACAVIGVVFAPHSPTRGGSVNTGNMMGGLTFPLPASLETTVAGVTPSQDASGNHYGFVLHLPANVPSATVNAYLLSNNDQITEPDKLAQATPALSPPQTLSNDESMTIPVTLLHPTPGGTLAMLVQWGPTNGQIGGQQVVFTPVLPTAATPQALPANSNIYDALQAVAAQDGVTVIADATNAPTQVVTLPNGAPSGPGHAPTDLKTLAGEVGATVQNVPGGAYLVSLPSASSGNGE